VKTISLKKVSAVAVASLGFGLLSVVPANATVAGAAITDVSDAIHLGGTATTAFAFTTTANAETATLAMTVPSGSLVTLTDNNGAETNTDDVVLGTDGTNNTDQDDTVFNPATGVITDTTTADDAAGTITIIPDVAGTYVVTLTAGATTDTYTVYAGDLWGEVSDGVSNGDQSNTKIVGVAGAYNQVTLSFRTIVGSRLIAVSGAGAALGAFTAGTNATGTISADKQSMVVADGGTAETATFTVLTPQVGTVTINSYAQSQGGIYSTVPYGTVTVTVGTAAQTGAISTTSTAVMTASGTGVLASDALSLTAASTANTTVGSIDLTLAFVAGSCLTTNVTTASITGPGLLTVSSGATNGTGRSLAEIGDCDFDIAIKGDGSTGTSTITVTSGAYSATRTVTFYGSASKIVATQNLKRASTAGATLGDTAGSTTSAVNLLVTDSTGNPVAGVTPTLVSSDSTVIASGSCSASSGKGASYCSVTSAANTAGKTASVTFKTTVSGVDVVSNASTFTLGGALATYTWAFDKTSYTAGSKITINITGVDAKGALTFDGNKDIFDTAITPSAASSYVSTTDLAGVDFVDGKATLTMFAPLTAGPFSVTAGIASGLQTAMGATSATLTTSVTDGSAAIITQIDALNAKIVALNALIAKIMKRLGVK